MGLTVITGAGGLWGKPDNVRTCTSQSALRRLAGVTRWEGVEDSEVDQFRKRLAKEVLAVSSGWGARTQASQDMLRAVGCHPWMRGGEGGTGVG